MKPNITIVPVPPPPTLKKVRYDSIPVGGMFAFEHTPDQLMMKVRPSQYYMEQQVKTLCLGDGQLYEPMPNHSEVYAVEVSILSNPLFTKGH